MRYLFTLIIISIVWTITVIIAAQQGIETSERFILYVCLIVLTAGLYKIGFTRK